MPSIDLLSPLQPLGHLSALISTSCERSASDYRTRPLARPNANAIASPVLVSGTQSARDSREVPSRADFPGNLREHCQALLNVVRAF